MIVKTRKNEVDFFFGYLTARPWDRLLKNENEMKLIEVNLYRKKEL